MSEIKTMDELLKKILQFNYFELFDLSMDYELATDKLTKNYLELQKQIHPDHVASFEDVTFQKRVTQCSAKINDAYQTLLSPLQRAKYMLQLCFKEYSPINRTTIRDSEFLMKQLAFREKLSGIVNQDNPLEAIAKLTQELQKEEHALEQQFLEMTHTQIDLNHASELVSKMQFFSKIKDEIDVLEIN